MHKTVALLFAAAFAVRGMAAPAPAAAQQWHWGAHGVGLITRVAPAVAGESLTEAYLTQPALFGGVSTNDDRFSLMGTLSLEGLTLDRGELGPGTYGEGYVDRRHPHTYLHELMAVAQSGLPFNTTGSLSAGRGFAPFGTDDPMMRPFVRFPVNHHLSQVLERLVIIGGVTKGPVTLEVGTFNGNEPLNAKDMGDIDRFGDSWAARVTLRPTARWEIQASRAYLKSPEEPTGQGDDQRKLSVSARHDGTIGGFGVYGLAEWSRATEINQNRNLDLFSMSSLLAEVALERSDWRGALRLEQTERPEEGREGEFRTPWPPIDHLIIGFTKWQVASIRGQRDMSWSGVRIAPYIETSLAHVTARDGFFDPKQFYGSDNLWSLSAGVRLDVGMRHDRMGRYGVALPATHMPQHEH